MRWGKIKQFFWQWRGVMITAPSVTLLVMIMRWLCLLMLAELSFFDQYSRLRPPQDPDPRIVIVGIDANDVEECCMIPKSDLIALLTQLQAQQPRAIGLNLHLNFLPQEHSKALIQLANAQPNLIAVKKIIGDATEPPIALPETLQNRVQISSNHLLLDPDSRVRRGLLYTMADNGEPIYGLSMHLALLYLQKEGMTPRIVEEGKIELGESVLTALTAYDGGYTPPLDERGYQIVLHYRNLSEEFEMVSMGDVLKGNIPENWGRDKVILIGAVSEEFQDMVLTPFSGGLHDLPTPMPDVIVHAHLTSQIIQAAMGERALILTWSELTEVLWVLFWSSVGAITAWGLRYGDKTKKVVIYFFFAVGALFGSTYLAFLGGWWLPVVPPLMGFVGSAIAVTIYIARTAGDIRHTFGRYLTDSVVATLLETPSGLKLGGERRTLTILTSDLRGFTAISERLSPEEVVKILNLYLEDMAEIISKYGGTIDEFMGDGILVLFGAPLQHPNDAERAIACALEMQLAMTQVNRKMSQLGLPELQMGIGIHTGDVVVGNIGSQRRTKYGVVGSDVNLTYRIESYTVSGQILISERTFQQIGENLHILSEKQVKPKGVKEPITIYEVGGITGQYNLFLPQEEQVYLPLITPLSLEYSVLEGKDIDKTRYSGKLIQLSAQSALIQAHTSPGGIPAFLSNLQLNFTQNPELRGDIYGKVVEKTAPSGQFYVYFTSQPPQTKKLLKELYKKLQTRHASSM